MSFIIGYILGSYVTIFTLTVLDIYLSIKLRRVRFEVAQGTFKIQSKHNTTLLHFDKEPRFIVEPDEETVFYRLDKFSIYNRDTLYVEVVKRILAKVIIIVLAPLFMTWIILSHIGISLIYLKYKLKNNLEAKYDLDGKISTHKRLFTEWYFGKKRRLTKGNLRVKEHKAYFNKLETEKLGKIKAARYIVFAVNFEDNKELI